jgi:hypothetical protein
MGKADRKSQTLREKGAESGGSLEKKMAELLKDSPLVCSAFLLSGTAACAGRGGHEAEVAEDAPMEPPEGCDTFFGALPSAFFSLGALTDHLDGEITATDFLA